MTSHTVSSLKSSKLASLSQHPPHVVQSAWIDAADVARRLSPEEPVFCFDPVRLSDQAGRFLAGFPGETAYAVKANSSREVIETLAKAGVTTFDIASIAEARLVKSVSPRATLHYHNPVKSHQEITDAFEQYGCRRFAADHPTEVQKIARALPDHHAIEIAVRFRLPSDGSAAHDFSSKFGCKPDEAVALLQQVADAGFKCVLTFHPGSQSRSPDGWQKHVRAAGDITARAGVRLSALNVGGGFPASYATMGPSASLETFFAVIANAVAAAFPSGQRPALECEPGRAMVAGSMSLLTRVKQVRSDRAELFINDGIYGNLLEMWQVPDFVPAHRFIGTGNQPASSSKHRQWTVYGPTCDPLDVLPVTFSLPAAIQPGDFIEFVGLGAYSSATSTRFNGYGEARIIAVGPQPD